MDIKKLKNKMENAILFFEKELTTIRTSRATTSMLDNIMVNAYDAKTPLNQLGNINVPDASTLVIQVWDKTLIKSIETAIIESKLGINPQSDGTLIRLPVPKLSEERRAELSKIASQYAETSKIAIRNTRRDGIEELKNEEKEKIISQDESKKISSEIQKITDEFTKRIDDITNIKKEEILKV